MARDIQNDGTIKFAIWQGEQAVYTRHNTDGVKPSADSKVVRFSYGHPLRESHLVVNRAAYLASRARRGIQSVRVLIDTTIGRVLHRPFISWGAMSESKKTLG